MSTTSLTTVEEAREIMGRNFHDANSTGYYFAAKPSRLPRKRFERVPFSAEVLQACADTHMLVACARLSLMDLWRAQSRLFYEKRDPWFLKDDFANLEADAGWRLICKNPLLNSTLQTWADQVALLSQDDEVVSVAVLAQAVLLHEIEAGERLFRWIHVRTCDIGSYGGRIDIGYFDPGLYIRSHWDRYRDEYIGLASARKPN